MFLRAEEELKLFKICKRRSLQIVKLDLTTWLRSYYIIESTYVSGLLIKILLEKLCTSLFHRVWVDFISSQVAKYIRGKSYRCVWIGERS